MDTGNTATIDRTTETNPFENLADAGDLTEKRLENLIKINTEAEDKKRLLKKGKDNFEVEVMENPLTSEQVFSYFGLLLGSLPPAAFFLRYLIEEGIRGDDLFWVSAFLLFVTIICSAAGYLTGKLVGGIVKELESKDWWVMLLTLPFVGLIWGMVSGGLGGVFILVIGAVFGSLIGGIVGAIALPIFSVFHRLFSDEGKMERDHFIPIAFGIAAFISALILGFPGF